MMKNILLVLDSGDSALMARDYALQLAKQHRCALTALALIDAAPLLEGEAMPPGAFAYRVARDASMEQRWRENARTLLEEVREQAGELDIALASVLAEDGHQEDELARHAPRHDLLVVSTDSHLGESERPHDSRWLENYLLNPARPMLLFSADTVVAEHPRCVVLAYDGSPCAARALQQFVFLGLAHDLPRKVVANHSDPQEAERLACEGAAYLASHGLPAEPVALTARGSASQTLIAAADSHGAALLVMGAFGHNSWKERLFGSTTRTLMKHCHVPLLMFH